MTFYTFMDLKAVKIARYFIFNAAFVGLLYYGFFKGVEGALNVALTLAWITAILGVIVLLGFMGNQEKMDAEISKTMAKDNHWMSPAWLDIPFDCAITLLFVWQGYIVLGIFYALHIVGVQYIRMAKQRHFFNILKSPRVTDE